jgi:UDP-2,3-diacylglucosamine hydrolase
MSLKAIQPGAVFIADAHYHEERDALFSLLRSFLDAPPPQIFLMGDIFDLLIGSFPYLMEKNRRLIDVIEALGEKTEVYFFEGNHDFLLEGRLKNLTYIPLSQQPMLFDLNGKTAALSHGDYDEGPAHNMMTRLLRNPLFIKLIHLVTLNFLGNWYLKKTEKSLKAKKVCRKFENFEGYIAKKIKKNLQNADVIIEGHYHQGVSIKYGQKLYYNVDGFACNQSYSVVESDQDKISIRANQYKR